jgi:hypothetical protein
MITLELESLKLVAGGSEPTQRAGIMCPPLPNCPAEVYVPFPPHVPQPVEPPGPLPELA